MTSARVLAQRWVITSRPVGLDRGTFARGGRGRLVLAWTWRKEWMT